MLAGAISKNITGNSKETTTDFSILSWIRERILNVLQENPTHLPPPMISSKVCEEWISTHSEKFKPKNEQIITVLTKEFQKTEDGDVLINSCIKNTKNNVIFEMPFSLRNESSFLVFPHYITMEATRIVHNIMIMPSCFVIELGRTVEDADILRIYSGRTLSTYTKDSPSGALIVRILDYGSNGFIIADDSSKPCELVLSGDYEGYKKIINVGDVMLIYNLGFIIDVDTNKYLLSPTKNTIFFRFPPENSNPNNFETCGRVLSIKHSTANYEWSGCKITIITDDGEAVIIDAPKILPSKVKTTLFNMKTDHYVWFFHLMSSSNAEYYLTSKSRVFDMNTIRAFYESLIVRPISIGYAKNLTSSVIRAVIVKAGIKKVTVHDDCQCVLSNKELCKQCASTTEKRIHDTLLFSLLVDDGNDSMELFSLLENFGQSKMCVDDFSNKEMDKQKIIEHIKDLQFQDDQIRKMLQKTPKPDESADVKVEQQEENDEEQSDSDDEDDDEIKRLITMRFKKAKKNIEEQNMSHKANTLYQEYQSEWGAKLDELVGSELVFMISRCNQIEYNFDGNFQYRVDYCSRGEGETIRTIYDLIEKLSK